MIYYYKTGQVREVSKRFSLQHHLLMAVSLIVGCSVGCWLAYKTIVSTLPTGL